MKPIDLRVEGARQGTMEVARNRIILVMAFFTLGFLSLAVKLISIGVFQANNSTGYQTANANGSLLMARADIVDRNGVVLATNLKTPSLGVHPKLIEDAELLSYKIAEVLPGLKRSDILEDLTSASPHAWIKRQLTPKQMFEINKLGEPGLVFSDAEKRIYPHGNLVSHVLGSVGFENKPTAGVELYYDERLSDPMRSEDALELSIDIRLQHILNQELKTYIDRFSARGGAGVILDVNSGEILALTSLPDFDPNEYIAANDPKRFNQILQGVYELGSGFKTFTIASGLDNGVVDLTEGFDASKPVRVSGFTIHDDHAKNRWLSIPEIYVYSSNIGTLKLAQEIGVERQKEFFEKLGLFRKTDVEVFEVARPILPRQWGPTELVTTSYGHGIAVTPLHLANGVAAMVNGGRLNPATLIRKDASDVEEILFDTEQPQVISKNTSELMRNLMHLVVEYGTGKSAKVDGYLIGGKTGTANKPAEKGDGFRGYKSEIISSFVSVFPIDKPKYVVFAMLDEPNGIKETFNMASGGWTAAPLVGNIIRRMGPLMGIEPTKTKEIEYEDLMLVSESVE
ncbi:MAG: penicillin-binding protein 2 [Kordiimonadaceae bacterium]|nr:penicillin-binding protein 2 [Kordiimonadaceae bacterium]MBT6036445.1 penicillin-binding protein 2 [Kordiimonadaceae bacterium]MBT6330074.1 penicillin-binding protein 2 [Kordiimonadaceae bacterium]